MYLLYMKKGRTLVVLYNYYTIFLYIIRDYSEFKKVVFRKN